MTTNLFRNLFRLFTIRVPAAITRGARRGLCGGIDQIDSAGIRGWLLDCAACDASLKVDAHLDRQFLGSGHTGGYRQDISETIGRPVHCEFLIRWEAATLLRELKGMERTRRLRIRVTAAESGRDIRAADDSVRTVDQLLDYVKGQAPAVVAEGLDSAFYLASNPDVVASGMDPCEHYCSYGWREGRNPAPSFDNRSYLDQNPDVAALGIDPFWHWLVVGRSEGRLPLGHSTAAVQIPDEDKDRIALIRTEFCESHYLSQNPDLAGAAIDPVEHYYHAGWREGRNPTKTFDTNYYLETNEDVRSAGFNPFWHYLAAGRREGRVARRAGGYRRCIVEAARTPEERSKDYAVPPGELLERNVLASRIDAAVGRAVGMVVSLSHDCYVRVIGGTQIFIADEQKRFAGLRYAYIHLSPRRARLDLAPPVETYEVQVVIDGVFVGVIDIGAAIAVLQERISVTGKQRFFIVHSVLGFNEEQVVSLRAALDPSRSVFWLHDYTSLCEGFNLLRNDVAFCNAPPAGSMACRICVYGAGRVRHLGRMQRLFEGCGFDVLAPSASALDLWRSRSRLPFASAAVHAHAQLVEQRCEEPPATSPPATQTSAGGGATQQGRNEAEEQRVCVGFVGFPAASKGWQIFSAMVEEFHDDPRYRFVHFAARDASSIPHCEFVVTEVTPGDRDATTRLLREHGIDFLAMLSPWPETFSFVAHEAIAAGCLLLCFRDSGNVAALVRRTGRGRVFDDAAALLSFFAGHEAVAGAVEARHRPRRFQVVHSGTTATVGRFFEENVPT